MLQNEKKKVDIEALNSPFMRVPKFHVTIARYLLDLGYSDLFQLIGLSPESLWADIKKKYPTINKDVLYSIRMLIYFVENDAPDPTLLSPEKWAY